MGRRVESVPFQDSPCHDEHVVYHITADKKNHAQLNIDADKIVNGSPQFMGTIFCQYHANEANLSCTRQYRQEGRLGVHMTANTMTGTLTLGPEKQLFRRINVRKTSPKHELKDNYARTDLHAARRECRRPQQDKMDDLRALYKSFKLEDPRTYVQSGNVIFRTKEKNSVALAKKIQSAIEHKLSAEST